MNTSTSDENKKKRLEEMQDNNNRRFAGYWGIVFYEGEEYHISIEDMDEALAMDGVRRRPVRLTSP